MGWFEEKEPIAGRVGDGGSSVEVDLCPRTILKRVVEYVLTASLCVH